MNGPELLELLETSGMPAVYHAWPEEAAPPLPYLVYLDAGSDNFAADGGVYHKINSWRVELYSEKKDFAAEERLEAVLEAAGICWSRLATVWIGSEKLYETIYEFEV